MGLRWLTGLLIAGMVGLAAWAGSLPWFALVMLLLAVAALEWARLSDVPRLPLIASLPAGTLLLLTPDETAAALLPLLLVIPATGMLWSQSPRRSRDLVWSAAGLVWLSMPAALLVTVRRELGFPALMVLLAGTAVQDTCALYGGRWFGGDRPFTPVISPNKTWAGFVASLLGMVLVCAASGWYLAWPLGGAVGLGVAMGLIGPLGDLSMSSLKRHARVEDTGVIFPGHGGILDRADGLVLNVVVFYPLVLWLEGLR